MSSDIGRHTDTLLEDDSYADMLETLPEAANNIPLTEGYCLRCGSHPDDRCRRPGPDCPFGCDE